MIMNTRILPLKNPREITGGRQILKSGRLASNPTILHSALGFHPFQYFGDFTFSNVLGISPFPMFWEFHLFQCFGDFTFSNILGVSPFQCFGDFTFSTVWKQYNFFLSSSGNLKGSTSARRTQVILNFYIWYKRVKVRKLFRKWKAKGESESGIIWALKVKVKQDFGESEKILVLTNGDGSFVNEIRIEKLSKV